MGLARDFAIHIIKLLACALAQKFTLYQCTHIFARMQSTSYFYPFFLLPWSFTQMGFSEHVPTWDDWYTQDGKKKKSGLQLRDSQPTSEDQHKTSLTEEAQASPCSTLNIPFHWDCKSIFLNLLIEFSNPYSSKAQSLSMSRFSH